MHAANGQRSQDRTAAPTLANLPSPSCSREEYDTTTSHVRPSFPFPPPSAPPLSRPEWDAGESIGESLGSVSRSSCCTLMVRISLTLLTGGLKSTVVMGTAAPAMSKSVSTHGVMDPTTSALLLATGYCKQGPRVSEAR